MSDNRVRTTAPPDDLGVLIMAHGSTPERRHEVLECVEPLASRYMIEVAFAIAYPDVTQAAIDALEGRGASRIAILRLLVSGKSYRYRTDAILGRGPGSPRQTPPSSGDASDDSTGESPSRTPFRPVKFGVPFALCEVGLADDPRMGEVLATRATDLSTAPETEDVLILAHGADDDDENDRWLAALDRLGDAIRAAGPFRRVHAETLREDWPEKREEAEGRVRAFVQRAAAEDGAAIVIPFRVHGFGPYEKVLAGLEYVADGRGLLPHPHVTEWIEEQIEAMGQELS